MINAFNDLMIVVEGKPVKLNVIGLLNVGGDEVIVLTDCPPLNIKENEYELFHLLRENGSLSIQDITNYELYQKLCTIWEEKIAEGMENDS
jgi:hypothetical protein